MKSKPYLALFALFLATPSCAPALHGHMGPKGVQAVTDLEFLEVLAGEISPVQLPIPGVPTVLAFLEPHCPPCKRTIADLNRLARRKSSLGIRFFIATPLEGFAQTHRSLQGSPITTLADPSGTAYRDVGAQCVPAVVFFDASSAQVALVEGNEFDSLHKALLRARDRRRR